MCILIFLPNKIGILVYKYIYLISIYGFQKFLAGRLPDIVRFFTCFFGFGVLLLVVAPVVLIFFFYFFELAHIDKQLKKSYYTNV